LRPIQIFDKIIRNGYIKISKDELEILLRFLEVISKSNFQPLRNHYNNEYLKNLSIVCFFLHENFNDIRVFNFFLKNKSILKNLKLDSNRFFSDLI